MEKIHRAKTKASDSKLRKTDLRLKSTQLVSFGNENGHNESISQLKAIQKLLTGDCC